MWTAFHTEHHGVQVVPDDDLAGHYADGLCPCVPTRQYEWDPLGTSDGGWVTTHNSWDGREAFEPDQTNFDARAADTMMAWDLGEMV